MPTNDLKTIYSANALEMQRAAGYKNTASALSELIDNSFDAQSKEVRVIFIEGNVDAVVNNNLIRTRKIVEILVCDDGLGMDKETLHLALRFGEGTSRTIDQQAAITQRRKGKFGFGLPNASISQCRVVKVYSWTDAKKVLTTKLDIPEFKRNNTVLLPEPEEVTLDSYLIACGAVFSKDHGTIVSWTDCDRLTWSTVAANIRNLKRRIGRLFRHLIEDNRATISFHHYVRHGNDIENLTPTANVAKPLDPLFLMRDTIAAEDIWKSSKSNGPHAKSYQKFAVSEVSHTPTNQKDENLSFSSQFMWGRKAYKFEFTASYANIDIQKPGVRNGGEYGIGQTFYGKLFNEDGNISFVRADREIETGTFNLYNRNAPENRWWAIEVKFDQDADDLMGVSNNKQGTQFVAHQIEVVDDGVFEDDGSVAKGKEVLFQWLTVKLREIQKQLTTKVKKQGREWDTRHDPKIRFPTPIPVERPETTSVTELVDAIRDHEMTSDDLAKLKTELKRAYEGIKDEDIQIVINSFELSRQKSVIIYAHSQNRALYDLTFFRGFLLITVNTNHPFYEKFISPLRQSNKDNEVAAFELLIHGFAFTEMDMRNRGGNAQIQKNLEDFRLLVGMKVENYLDNLLIENNDHQSDEDEE